MDNGNHDLTDEAIQDDDSKYLKVNQELIRDKKESAYYHKSNFVGTELKDDKLFNLFDAAQEAGDEKFVSNTMLAKELIDAWGTQRSREIAKLINESF